ncbi:MAG: polysaccharide biosynthesis/export family protein [Cyanobacteria bacterium P01_F01_bin.86]
MALLGSQLRFVWLSRYLYWSGSGLSIVGWLLFSGTPVLATSPSSQTLLTTSETVLADGHEAEPPSAVDTSIEELEETSDTVPDSETNSIPPPPSLEESPERDPFNKPDSGLTAPLPEPDAEIPVFPAIPESDDEAPGFPATPLPPQPPTFPESGLQNFILGIPDEPDFDTYRLGPGDSFFVSVPRFPDLSFQATLDIEGNVILPLEGVTSFNGLTLEQSENKIRAIYDQYVVNPDVGITLVAQRGVEVTILGEVVRPGFYPLGAPQISTALLSAGGTTGDADLREVLIQRQLPNGGLQEQVVDLFTPLKEGQEIPNVALQDGDVIVVERLDPAVLDEYDRDLVARSTLAQPTITVRLLTYGAAGGNLRALTIANGSRFADVVAMTGLNPDVSNLNEIGLVRFDEEAGKAVTLTLDGNAAFRGDPSENPPLHNNDVIIVNRTLLARITYALNIFTQPFRDVLGFILFFDSLADSAGDLFGP